MSHHGGLMAQPEPELARVWWLAVDNGGKIISV